MKTRWLFISVLLCFPLGLLSGLPTSWGYIPPSQFILKTWIAKHKALKSVRIKSTVTAYRDGQPSPLQFSETLIYQSDTKNLKSVSSDGSNRRLYMIQSRFTSLPLVGKLLIGMDPHEVAESLRENRIAIRGETDLLKCKTEIERLNSEVEVLTRLNVNTSSPGSLPIFSQGSGSPSQKPKTGGAQRIAWIIGPMSSIPEPLPAATSTPVVGSSIREGINLKPPRVTLFEPQIWFEKDSFLPLRLIYEVSSKASTGGGNLYGFQFENYRTYLGDFPYPRTVLVEKKDSGILFSVKIEELAINVPVDAKPSLQFVSGFTPQGESAGSDLKDLIRLYYDLFRTI